MLLLVACAEPTVERSAIVLVIDGVRTDEYCAGSVSDLTGEPGEASAPRTWETLAANGAYSRAALNPGITVTAPAHAAMLVGRLEPHANFPMDEGTAVYRPLLPTIFEVARQELDLAEDDVALVANTEVLAGLTASVSPMGGGGAAWHYVTDGDDGPADDRAVIDAILARIDAGPPRLIVANLHDVDRAAHTMEAAAYPMRIARADDAIGDLYDALERDHPDYLAQLLFVVTADHGRHRPAGDEAWRTHGDSCDGCRELPLFVAGAGAAGELAAAPLAPDLAPTVAGWLGFDVPWAEGLPIGELDLPRSTTRSGDGAFASSGERTATQVWQGDVAARSIVAINGETVSTPGALAAEAPAIAAVEGVALACWREFEEWDGLRPWIAHCAAGEAGTWRDVGFATSNVGPSWRPVLASHGDTIWAAWAHNPNGTADAGGDVGLAVASWSAAASWSGPVTSEAYFPTDPALVVTSTGLVAAFGTNLAEPASRITRRVRVVPLTLTDDGRAIPVASTDFARDDARIELPALWASGDDVRLAMIAIEAGSVDVEVAESADAGVTWRSVRRVPSDGLALPHLAPVWDEERVVWAAWDGAETVLCRARPDDADAECVPAGSPRVRAIDVRDGVATVLRDAGTAEWEQVTVAW